MKMNPLMLSLVLALTVPSFASADSRENQETLNMLQAHRESTLWSCTNSSPYDKALEMFTVDESASGIFSNYRILAITDKNVCHALNVTCPFVAGVSDFTFGMVSSARYSYWSTRGRSEDTVMFFADRAGMKVISISNGSQPRANWDLNWYFGPGTCFKD